MTKTTSYLVIAVGVLCLLTGVFNVISGKGIYSILFSAFLGITLIGSGIVETRKLKGQECDSI